MSKEHCQEGRLGFQMLPLVSCFFSEHNLGTGCTEVRARRDGGVWGSGTQLGVSHPVSNGNHLSRDVGRGKFGLEDANDHELVREPCAESNDD